MELHKLFSILALIICFIKRTVTQNYSIVCDQVQETKRGSVQIIFRRSTDELNRTNEAILLKDDKRVLFCKSFRRCQINDQYSEMFHLYETMTDNAHYVNVTMREVLRDSVVSPEGAWSLTYFERSNEQMIESCSFYVYDVPSEVTCHYMVLKCNETLQIVCTASRIYPPMKCFIDDSAINNTITIINTTYRHTTYQGHPLYYNSTCDILVQLNNITSGSHALNIVAFPDITGTSTDVLIGRNITLIFNTESESLSLKECPRHVQEGTGITCPCLATGCDVDPESIHWTSMIDNLTVNAGSNILYFIASKSDTAFRCQAKDKLDAKSFYIDYKPEIFTSNDILS